MKKIAATALMAYATIGSAVAQQYPTRPVTLMVPYPVGGLSDVIARTIHNTLAKHLGQPVIVENLGGASGGIAAQKVLSAPADGHMIFQGSPNELIMAPMASSALKYRSEDFRLVQMISQNPMALFARADLPVSNGDELAAYAKKMAAAGKPMTYASVGPGSMYHLLGAYMSKQFGVSMTHVPYKGAAAVFQGMVGGETDIFMTPYGKSQIQLVETGKIKAPAVLSTGRQALLPKAVPLNDSKALKGFVFDIWAGYFVRKDTPEHIVKALHKALSETANSPEVRKVLEAQAMVVPSPLPLDKLSQVYAENTTKYRAIARLTNLNAQ